MTVLNDVWFDLNIYYYYIITETVRYLRRKKIIELYVHIPDMATINAFDSYQSYIEHHPLS